MMVDRTSAAPTPSDSAIVVPITISGAASPTSAATRAARRARRLAVVLGTVAGLVLVERNDADRDLDVVPAGRGGERVDELWAEYLGEHVLRVRDLTIHVAVVVHS